jgi:putative cell wall-binding protein
VQVNLYEYYIDGLWPADQGTTDANGDYSVTGIDFWYKTYEMRFRRPGYITKDAPQFAIPPTTINMALAPDQQTERVSGSSRYSGAVRIARERYTSHTHPTGWWGVNTIILASGEDRAAADPLAAAGLCGAYDAPLFLVGADGLSDEVKQAVREISESCDQIRVIVVGGPVSVSDSVFDEVDRAGSGTPPIRDRILATGDRYDLAAAIALRMKQKSGNVDPTWALIANGADYDKFFDALALSTIAAGMQYPILLVSENDVPDATVAALDELGGPALIVGGGPATVSEGVRNALAVKYGPVTRWSGADRYTTAITIGTEARDMNWLDARSVAVAAKLPDALAGGAIVGQDHGILLLTQSDVLTPATGNWLANYRADIDKCYVYGGSRSVSDAVVDAIEDKLE